MGIQQSVTLFVPSFHFLALRPTFRERLGFHNFYFGEKKIRSRSYGLPNSVIIIVDLGILLTAGQRFMCKQVRVIVHVMCALARLFARS